MKIANMKTAKQRELNNNNGQKNRRPLKQIPSIRPLTAPGKEHSGPFKLVDRPNTLSPSTESLLRPKTTVGFYEDLHGYSLPSRPKSASGMSDDAPSVSSTPRSSFSKKPRQPKGSRSPKGRRKSIKPKTHIAWDDTTGTDQTSNDKERLRPQDAKDGDHPFKSPAHSKSKKASFKPMSLVPGSVSTMVALQESEEDEEISENVSDGEIKTPKAPCFADVLISEASSDYDTDLEEDFPEPPRTFDPSGREQYIKSCKQKDLVPVSFLSKRFKEKEIIMRHHGLGKEGTLPIARSLKKNTFTEKLDLTDNYIERHGAIAISQMLVDNCFITEIDLSMNFIRTEGGIAFGQMLYKNQSLKKLSLRSNHLTDKVAKVFADALKENRTLTYLDLSHNEIGELGGIYLGAGLAMNYGLKHFDVSWNSIRFKGAVGLAQALKTNDCLTHFNISWNGLSLLGCVALGRFLKKNEALIELDISNNRIGLLGTQKLAAGISSHPNLKVLKIGRNPIGDVGVECLLNVIRTHNTIKFLSLEDITVSPKIFDEIIELEKERDLKVITGGIGGYKRPKEMPPGMRILLDFVQDNRLRLIDWFNQFDKDQSGGISREEFRKGLKETGLVMTTRQLDRLIKFIDINDDGEIDYSELLRGREITLQELRHEKKLEERNRRIEEDRMKLPKLEGYDYDLM
ncbi:leucine-rich repeat-containing protein 74A-like [Actinia tenebrosa]|uniref:Leucine-rich repeat-containing protein 74A-like n=1 Tax=Actinia tenebrosa TaxID=6105 RepID=A0A6P8J1Z6_ACTTE|nr:leucine-rich repeat-containing protein 74A-like [Actinia tenebrosa]